MSDNTATQMLVFRIGAELFGTRLVDVDEVIELPVIQPIPDAAPGVLGIAAVHGSFIVAYDPRPLLHVGGRIDGAALLFMHDNRRVAVAVGDVYDALTVERSDIRPLPMVRGTQTIMVGVIRRGADLIGVVNSSALLDAAMSGNAAEVGRQQT